MLRDGETVGVVDMAPGAEERIVELMLGARLEHSRAAIRQQRRRRRRLRSGPARLGVRNLRVGTKLKDVSFDLRDGEVAGVVALEGQGQDELFGALSGSMRPAGGSIEVDGADGAVRPSGRRDPRRHRLCARRPHRGAADAALGAREHRAAVQRRACATGGRSTCARRTPRSTAAIERLQIDTRAQREVQRLSGGNQQKVTIARWIAAGARTILCFDPTRGIDVRTKREIYRLLRELAGQGTSVLFYTSELEEVQLVCDRAIVIFGGRVVDVLPVEIADEAALTRAAYGLPRDAEADVGVLAGLPGACGGRAMIRHLRRQGWVAGLFVLFALLLVVTKLIQPSYGAGDFGSLARAVLPYRLRRRRADDRRHRRRHRPVDRLDDGGDQRHRRRADGRRQRGIRHRRRAVRARRWASCSGAINGVLIVVTRVPDIVVTLAMLFVCRAWRCSSSRRRAAPPPSG